MFIRFIHHSHPVMFSVILFVSLFTLDVVAQQLLRMNTVFILTKVI